jgi:hypothetical protein
VQGAEFDLEEVAITAEDERVYTQCSELFFEVKAALEEASRACELEGKQSPVRLFWSVQQRFFRDLISSFKVPKIKELTEAALAQGHCVVIGLQSTGEVGGPPGVVFVEAA